MVTWVKLVAEGMGRIEYILESPTGRISKGQKGNQCLQEEESALHMGGGEAAGALQAVRHMPGQGTPGDRLSVKQMRLAYDSPSWPTRCPQDICTGTSGGQQGNRQW